MLNHKTPKQCEWDYDDANQGFYVKALEDISRGSEIFYSYGEIIKNHRFFMNYGFVVDQEDHNEVPIIVKIDQNDPLWAEKAALLPENALSQCHLLETNLNLQSQKQFLAFIRYITFNDNPALLLAYKQISI